MKYRGLWIAIGFLFLAGLACQSQGAITTPVVADPQPVEAQAELPDAVEAQPSGRHVIIIEGKNIDISSSIEAHSVLAYSVEPEPTLNPDTGLSGAELLQLGAQPVAAPFNPPVGCEASTDADFEAVVLKHINDERARYGLAPLSLQYQLTAAAVVHTLDMACKNFFSHTGSDGSSPFDRIKTQGYVYFYAGENLFAGNGVYNDPGQAVSAWMKSPGHRANILKPEFTEAGISYTYNPNSTYGGYFAIVFARP
jgi:uncharacterized protein YkwD